MSTRSDRIKKGNAARERVLSGKYNQPTVEVQPQGNRRSMAVRAYQQQEEERVQQVRSVAPEITSNGGLDILKNSPRFTQQQPQKQQSTPRLEPSAQRLVNQEMKLQSQNRSSQSKEAQIKSEREKQLEWFDKNGLSAVGKGVGTVAEFIDSLRFGNTAGRAVDRATQKAAELSLPVQLYEPVSTGNKFLDKAADVAAYPLSFAVNPAQTEANLIQGGYKVGEKLLSSGVGGKASNLISKGLEAANPALNRVGVNIGANTANKAAQNIVRGGTAGAISETAQGMQRGETDANEIALNAILGGTLGGIGDAAAEGVGSLVKRISSRSKPDALNTNQILPDNTNVPVKQTQEPTIATTQEINDIQAPKSNWFSNLFGNKGVGISPFGSSKSNKILTTEDQLVKNPIKSDIQGAVEGTKATARATYQNFVDYLSPLKKISPEAYDAAIDASRANNLANTIITDKFVNNQGQVIGNSLKDIISNTGRGNAKSFDDYLIARHALTRMERGEQVYDISLNMTPEKISQRVATLEQRYPQFKALGEEWNNYNRNMINNAVEEGLISRNAADAMFEQNPNYAAMRRQFTTSEKLAQPKFGGTGQSFSGQKAPIKSYSPVGSTRRIVSPTRSAMEQAYAFKNAELRNRTMQEITKSIQLDPDGMKGIAEIVKKPSTSYKSLDDALREGGSEEFIEQLDNDFRSLFQKTKTGEENIVRAMVNGNPVYVKVHDPEAVKALLGMGNEQAGIVMNAMNILSRATKRGATGLFAPMFAIKNVGADTIQAAIQSPNAFRHLFVDVPTAFISSIGDTFKIPGINKLAEEFRRAGGEYSGLLKGDRAVNRNLGKLRREPLLSPKGVAKGAYNVAAAPFKALEKVADVTENLNRMAAFNREIRGTNRSPQDVRKAISAARESTVNFSRRGAMSQGIEAFVPYQNAAIQSLQRLGTQIIKHPGKTLAGVGTLVILPKFYEYSQFNGDPDYQKLPARERYRNLIISKNADGTFNKVPMPPEYEAMAAFFTDVLNDVVDKDPQAYKGTLSAIADAFTPPIVGGALQGITQGGGFDQSIKGFFNSTVLAPGVAIAGNQSFTGAPIVPERLKDVSTKNQYDERTSEISKWIGDKLGMAPLKVDYLIKAYGGDPARLLLPLNSPVGGGTPKQTLLKNFIVDPVFTNTLSNDYFDAKDKYIKAENDNADYGDPLPSWYDESMAKIFTSQKKGSVSKQLSALNNDKREVQGDRTLSADAKAQKLRSIQSQINDIYVEVNSKLESSGYKFPNR